VLFAARLSLKIALVPLKCAYILACFSSHKWHTPHRLAVVDGGFLRVLNVAIGAESVSLRAVTELRAASGRLYAKWDYFGT
jgi:hypothetical protein